MWAGVSLSQRLMGWSSAEAVKSMGAAVPLPFISGKALSPCVLLEVEGFRVEEPFPLQLSDEESSARKDVWSPYDHPPEAALGSLGATGSQASTAVLWALGCSRQKYRCWCPSLQGHCHRDPLPHPSKHTRCCRAPCPSHPSLHR